ncbi:MAG TPA: CapA family protein [Chloroflexia bacterium]|nr:CapA family protein [Chloroflexia bacterium]
MKALLLSACMSVVALLAGVSVPPQGTDGAPVGDAHLVFVGDLMLGRYVGSSLRGGNFDSPFTNIKSFLSQADLAIGNLEGPIVPLGAIAVPTPAPNLLNLTGDARGAPALARAGFDLLSVANNHALDSGGLGLMYTVRALKRAGISPFGLDGGTSGQTPVIREVHGLRIAFLAYTDVLNIPGSQGVAYVRPWVQADLDRMAREVREARNGADLVVVMLHGGTEYSFLPDSGQKAMAQSAAGAGADLIVGSHPHVVQGMDVLQADGRSVPVAYSLGNALFDQVSRPELMQGFALEATLDSSGVRSARLVPLQTIVNTGYKMNLCDSVTCTQAIQNALPSTPASLQWQAMWGADSQKGQAIAYLRSGDGERSSSEELGTGAPTIVQLKSGTLSVQVQNAQGMWNTAWVSDEGWRVTGYTVGDANADGRPDLVYTLWKRSLTAVRPPDGGLSVDYQGGDVLPHIYINSWRDGEMRPLWHGSPRTRPLLGVAVAPLGADNKPLLATLESRDPEVESPPGPLSLWGWAGGFGFELVQSLPGTYSQIWSDGSALMFR